MFIICLKLIIYKGTNIKILVFGFFKLKINLIFVFSNSDKKNMLFKFIHLLLFRIQINSRLFRFRQKKKQMPLIINSRLVSDKLILHFAKSTYEN